MRFCLFVSIGFAVSLAQTSALDLPQSFTCTFPASPRPQDNPLPPFMSLMIRGVQPTSIGAYKDLSANQESLWSQRPTKAYAWSPQFSGLQIAFGNAPVQACPGYLG
jgi:hypothetical protein